MLNIKKENCKCNKCNIQTNYWYKTNKYKNYSILCKKCFFQEYYKKNKEKALIEAKKNYTENKQEYLASMKKYYEKNKEKIKKYNQNYWKKNKEKLGCLGKQYYKKNKKEIFKKTKIRNDKRKKYDINYVLKSRLSSRIRSAIFNHKGIKETSSLELLGANINVVRKHIEKQFEPGMTWQNHSIVGWHIDHIVPCNFFDLTKLHHQKLCFHYTNLQPLWYKDNILKGNKLDNYTN